MAQAVRGEAPTARGMLDRAPVAGFVDVDGLRVAVRVLDARPVGAE